MSLFLDVGEDAFESEPEPDDPDDDVEVQDDVNDSYKDLLEKLSEKWITLEINHRMSKTASNELWELAKSTFPRLHRAKMEERVCKKIPKFPTLRDKLYATHVPKIRMEIAYKNKETGGITIIEDALSTPVTRFHPHLYEKLYESAKVEVRSQEANQIYAFHIATNIFQMKNN